MQFTLHSVLAIAAAEGALAAGVTGRGVDAQPHHPSAQKAMFATKAKADAAAKQFHCTGAHPMASQWMPCGNHAEAKPPH